MGVSKEALDGARPHWYIRREWIGGCWQCMTIDLAAKGLAKDLEVAGAGQFTAIFPFPPFSTMCSYEHCLSYFSS